MPPADIAPLSLHELNGLVRATIEYTLDRDYWLAAELSEVRPAAAGHCYLEFVEKDARGTALVAKARGTVWRSVYTLLAATFEEATGRRLAPGMKVLVRVRVSFHELYGYALDVTDIDPAYTLGDMARRRRDILRQLDADGVTDLNKELPLPRPLQRIAVISSATAAGYGDFCRQLADGPYRFETRLFAATMQGDTVERSVIAALDRVAAEAGRWDAVVIIRGGGAVSDLDGFDTYLLAANVAQFPLPVITGIGHERDETVLDVVAHTRCKTPTAVAAFLLQHARTEDDRLRDAALRLHAAAAARLEALRRRFDDAARRFHLGLVGYGHLRREQLHRLSARLELTTARTLERQHAAQLVLAQRLEHADRTRTDAERARLALLARSVDAASPERILRLGYSLTLRDGRVVRSAAALRPGDRIVTRLAEGSLESVVTDPQTT